MLVVQISALPPILGEAEREWLQKTGFLIFLFDKYQGT